ncbi:hypothetical protein O6H91_17G066000 [Diphasiastrum complanatum]|uniref:Uncharacterized protein n=1 Tax=Diphasiastrum complanatum TaxID=34168 RepID=A0ACC2B7J5_DIPCM|nr:hypothetical protein O6H91_17G066000 [Diphasiastrum complanatum]
MDGHRDEQRKKSQQKAWYNVPMVILAQLIFKEDFTQMVTGAISKIDEHLPATEHCIQETAAIQGIQDGCYCKSSQWPKILSYLVQYRLGCKGGCCHKGPVADNRIVPSISPTWWLVCLVKDNVISDMPMEIATWLDDDGPQSLPTGMERHWHDIMGAMNVPMVVGLPRRNHISLREDLVHRKAGYNTREEAAEYTR